MALPTVFRQDFGPVIFFVFYAPLSVYVSSYCIEG